MNRKLITLLIAIKSESCARMRKRISKSNRALFSKQVMATNIHQAMAKL
jgi:hypothetical protein